MKAVVSMIMGSISDLPVLAKGREILKKFGVEYEIKVISAHRTPELMQEFALAARSRGIQVIIAAAGGAAHLPGMVAALTTLPVIGVPVSLKNLDGLDSALSILQMPTGVPVATVAIDNSSNASLLALRILALGDEQIAQKLVAYREEQKSSVAQMNVDLSV